MKKRTMAESLSMGITGATGGAKAGSAFGPYGTAAGGVLGGLLGGVGGYLDAQAQEQDPAYQLNLEEQRLNNDSLKRKGRTDQTAENGYNIFKNFLGSAFSSNNPAGNSFGANLANPYPGLKTGIR